MASPGNSRGIDDPSDIYEARFDAEVDQSAIYAEITFTCIGKPSYAIVLTPICDIATKKLSYITLAQIIPANIIYEMILFNEKLSEQQMIGVEAVGSGKLKHIKDEFLKNYLKNRVYRYHFLPKLNGILDNSFIDFQVVQTFSIEELIKHKKTAVLKSPWRESIPARYAAYSVRIGTPDFSDNLFDSIHNEISELNKHLGTSPLS